MVSTCCLLSLSLPCSWIYTMLFCFQNHLQSAQIFLLLKQAVTVCVGLGYSIMLYKVVILLNFIIFIVYVRTSLSSYITGPPCTVTSMIPGSPTMPQMEGNCASILTCRKLGGVPIGKCGLTSVCCICEYFDGMDSI